MSFAATWMDPVIVILSEKDKDRYHVIRFICASLKKKKKNQNKRSYLQNRNRIADVENKVSITRGIGGKIGRLGLTYTHYCI